MEDSKTFGIPEAKGLRKIFIQIFSYLLFIVNVKTLVCNIALEKEK